MFFHVLAAMAFLGGVPGLNLASCPWVKNSCVVKRVDHANNKRRRVDGHASSFYVVVSATCVANRANSLQPHAVVQLGIPTHTSDCDSREVDIQAELLRHSFKMAVAMLKHELIAWPLLLACGISGSMDIQVSELKFFQPDFIPAAALSADIGASLRTLTLDSHRQSLGQLVGDSPLALLVIPQLLGRRIRHHGDQAQFIITPSTYAEHLGLQLLDKSDPDESGGHGGDSEDDFDDADDEEGEPGVDDTRMALYPVPLLMKAVELTYMLHSCDQLKDIIVLCASLSMSPDDALEFERKVCAKEMRLPSKSALYRHRIKFDWLCMLYQRRLFARTLEPLSTTSWSSQFAADASSQSGFDYFNCTEERIILAGDCHSVAQRARVDGVLRCFEYERRTMPPCVLGMGMTSLAEKLAAFAKRLVLESSADLLGQRRGTARGWLADQGTELGIGDCPWWDGDIAGIIERLEDKTLAWADDEVINTYFFPHALVIPDHLHIFFNALEESLKSSEAWPVFEPVLREISKFMGDKLNRDS